MVIFSSKIVRASNKYYDAVPEIVVDYMNQVNEKCGTDYKPFNYYGAPDAEKVIIAMGSVCDTAEEVIDYLTAAGEKVGLVKVRLYRPFVAKYLLDVLPKTVKSISVLDRTKEPGSIGEPLYLDVVAALKGTEFETTPCSFQAVTVWHPKIQIQAVLLRFIVIWMQLNLKNVSQ